MHNFKIRVFLVFTYILNFHLKLLKKNQLLKLTCLAFRAIFDELIMKIAVTVGDYLMETTLNFVASVFAMTNQRFVTI